MLLFILSIVFTILYLSYKYKNKHSLNNSNTVDISSVSKNKAYDNKILFHYYKNKYVLNIAEFIFFLALYVYVLSAFMDIHICIIIYSCRSLLSPLIFNYLINERYDYTFLKIINCVAIYYRCTYILSIYDDILVFILTNVCVYILIHMVLKYIMTTYFINDKQLDIMLNDFKAGLNKHNIYSMAIKDDNKFSYSDSKTYEHKHLPDDIKIKTEQLKKYMDGKDGKDIVIDNMYLTGMTVFTDIKITDLISFNV